jgi:hypothetical protein
MDEPTLPWDLRFHFFFFLYSTPSRCIEFTCVLSFTPCWLQNDEVHLS